MSDDFDYQSWAEERESNRPLYYEDVARDAIGKGENEECTINGEEMTVCGINGEDEEDA